jgi:hypothetical protein
MIGVAKPPSADHTLSGDERMRTNRFPVRAAVVVALLWVAALGCTEKNAITNVDGLHPEYNATRTSVEFTVGPLALNGIEQAFPGPNWHLRDVLLSGSVTGDLEGQASLTLNANLDGQGNGPTWGTMTIVTPEGQWQGTLTGQFQGDLPTGILLTSRVVMHGPPGQRLLRAECDETPPSNSETLACSGEVS